MGYGGRIRVPLSDWGIDISKCKFLGRFQLNATQNLWIKFYYRISDETPARSTKYDIFMELEPVLSPYRYPYGLNLGNLYYNDRLIGSGCNIKESSADQEYPDPAQWGDSLWSGLTVTDSSKGGTFRVSFNISTFAISNVNVQQKPTEEETVNMPFEFLLEDGSAASSLTVGDGELGTPLPITVTRFNNSYNHTVSYVKNGYRYGIATRTTETSLSWTPPNSLAELNTTGENIRMKIYIHTYDSSGAEVGYRYYYINLRIPSSITPGLSLSVDDAAGLFQRYGGYIQSKSKARASLSVTEAYGAEIVASEMQLGTQWTKISPYDFTLDNSGTLSIVGRAKDTRNHESITSVPITVIPYFPPRITGIDRYRCNADGSPNGEGAYACVIFSAEVAPVNNQNSASYKVQIRDNSLGVWTDNILSKISGNYTPSNIAVIFQADPETGYEVRVCVTDDFTEQFSGTRQIPPAAALLEVDATGTGMAIGQMAKEPGILRINLPTFFNHDLSVTGKVEAENVKFGIVESGASADGVRRYIKFADGTLVQWAQEISTQLAINQSFYSAFRSSVRYFDFLVPFADTNISVIANAATNYGSTWAAVTEVTTERVKFQLLDFEARSSGISVMTNIIAIGRYLP